MAHFFSTSSSSLQKILHVHELVYRTYVRVLRICDYQSALLRACVDVFYINARLKLNTAETETSIVIVASS